jgi:hypothetical protein
MFDTASVEGRGPSLHSMHLIALRKEQFGEIRSVLASGARDQGYFTISHMVPFLFDKEIKVRKCTTTRQVYLSWKNNL